MADSIGPKTIFQMAIRMEEKGSEFYRRAADNAPDEELARILRDLAVMEDQHAATFLQMMKDAPEEPEEGSVGPDKTAYIESMVDDFVFDLDSEDEAALFKAPKEHVLRAAIGKEKESIVFYNFLMEFARDEKGRVEIKNIISEELKHITTLRMALGMENAGK